MTRYFRDLKDAWSEYRLIHTIASRVAGLSLLTFCCFCFWMIFQHAEPTTVSIALLTFMAFCGVFLIGGQKAAEAWTHRNDQQQQQSYQPAYQQNNTSGSQATADAADDAEGDKSDSNSRAE